MKYLIKIETTVKPCYLADWEGGDPPRSFEKRNAKRFDSKNAAEAEIAKLQNQFPLPKRQFWVESESA